MAESFDAVLAELASRCKCDPDTCCYWCKLHDRLQSAHAADVAEVRESTRHEAVAMGLLADRAVGLLRELRATGVGLNDYWGERFDAFLSEQAGKRENRDG